MQESKKKIALELADRAHVLETDRIVLEVEGKHLLNDPYVKKAYLGARA